MQYYETLYILNPNFEQARVDDIIKEIEEHTTKFSTVINHRVWGKKRLAYPIDRHKYGTYVLLQFETEKTDALDNYKNFMKLNNSVLRHQNVNLAVKPEMDEGHILDDSSDILEENSQVGDIQSVLNKTDRPPAKESSKDEEEKDPETIVKETSA